MDQNSSNGSGKSNWREKLGIGGNPKEIPKIADEFKPAGPAANTNASPARPQRPEPKVVAKPAPRAPQPVSKPAPMAPRPAQVAPPQPPAPAAVQPSSAEPKSESLAERLKSQRQAAERLAEQRINAVRENVKEAKPSPAPTKAAEPPAKPKPVPAPSSDAPKFSFAEEELASAKVDTTRDAGNNVKKYVPAFQPSSVGSSPAVPPLVPPRPALGGEKPVVAPVRQDNTGYGGSPGPQPPIGYRPLDPPPYQTQRPIPPLPPRNGYSEGGVVDPRPLPGARREQYDPMRRPSPARIGSEINEPTLPMDDPGRTRRPLPQRNRRPASYDDDLGEVFEDEDVAPAPRRRARAQDYSQAYREYEDNYVEEERRSSGPWLLLLALLALAAVAFGGIWWYSKYIAQTGGITQTGGETPVVPAPQNETKAPQPEQATTAPSNEAAPVTKKKVIYDRILGDQAIEGGTITPTEEPPTAIQPLPEQTQGVPSPAPGSTEQGGAIPLPQPTQPSASGTQSTDPAPDAGAGQSEPLPLPVPPTPGSDGTQGNLTPVPGQSTAGAPAVATVSPASSSGTETIEDIKTPASPSGESSGAQALAPTFEPEPETPETPSVQESEPVEKPVVKSTKSAAKPKKKTQTAAKTQKKPQEDVQEPIVLVPENNAQSDQPSTEQAQSGSTSGSFFGSGRSTTRPIGKQDDKILSAGRTNFSAKKPEQPQASDTQVASLEPADTAQPAPEPSPPKSSERTVTSSSGGGYVAQLASFRSEAEALSEFDRLKGKHSSILGSKSPRVSKGTVAGTTRYRLAVGPMSNRDEASKLCNSLIASGERDCIVKQQ